MSTLLSHPTRIAFPPKPRLILFSHMKIKTLFTKSRALIVNKSNSSSPSRLTALSEEAFRTKETFSVCLFIPLLAQYLFTPVTHLFFSLALSLPLSGLLSPAAFSHTQTLQRGEKDLGDHLKPIMAALQPPRNSVTDGDLVFIAGVIGNTQRHT